MLGCINGKKSLKYVFSLIVFSPALTSLRPGKSKNSKNGEYFSFSPWKRGISASIIKK